MKKKIKHTGILLIMLLTLLKTILPVKADETPEFHRHQINLSGNILEFSIPENFSRDMPAHDMVENVNLADPKLFQDSEYKTLIRRWWDFKQPGFFSDNKGSLMMSLTITKSKRDILSQTNFVLEINEALNTLYAEQNNTAAANNQPELVVYLPILDGFENIEVNNQRWIRTGTAGQIRSHLNYIPILKDLYLIMDITYMPSNKYATNRDFLNQLVDFGNTILNSTHITYQSSNPARVAVEGNDFIDMSTVIKKLANSKPAYSNINSEPSR